MKAVEPWPSPSLLSSCYTRYGHVSVIGMTSEGGGAVAFPVITLVLVIQDTVCVCDRNDE